MSYAQVQAILDAIDNEDPSKLESVLDIWDEQDEYVYGEMLEELARSLYYVLYSCTKKMQPEARKEWRENLTNGSVREELADILWEEENTDG